MLARKAILHYLNTIVGGILGAVALKLIALYMGDAILGNVAYALGLLNIVQELITPGAIRTTHEKRIGEGDQVADKTATYLYLQLGLNALFATLTLGGIAIWTAGLGKGFHSTTLMVLVIVAGSLIAQNLRQVGVNTFNGRREIARSQTITIIDDLARVAFTVLVTALYAAVVRGRGPFAGLVTSEWGWVADYGPELLASTYLIGSAASALFGLVFVARKYPIGSFDWDIAGSYWTFAWPLFLGGLLGTLSTNVDKVMLGYFWSGATVGLYFGLNRITHIIKSLTFALGTVLLPVISDMASDGNKGEIAEVVRRSHRYTTMVLIPMVVGVMVFAEPLIRLILSAEFLRGVPVLWVMGVWVFFHVANRPYGSAVLGLDRPKLTLFLGIFVVFIDITLNAILIPADIEALGLTLFGLGALGAALASLVAAVIRYVGTRYFARELLPLRSEWPYLLRHFVGGAAMAGSLWGMQQAVPGLIRWYHAIVFGLVGVGIYAVVLWLLGELTRDDVEFFLEVSDPGGMGSYIREELFGDDEG